jgi:DNA-directed RNA polymerase II subunit RPB1
MQVIEEIRELCRRTMVVPGEDRFSKEAQGNATILLNIMLRSTFAAKRVLLEYRLTRNALKYIVGQIEHSFLGSQVGIHTHTYARRTPLHYDQCA